MTVKSEAWRTDPHGERAVRLLSNMRGSGDWIGRKVKLAPFQEDLIRRFFGTRTPEGKRQYKTLFLALPRKQGKSSIIAWFVVLFLRFGKRGHVIYSISGCREQAAQIYEYIRDAIVHDDYLSYKMKVYKNTCKIVDLETGNTFQALTADGNTKFSKNTSVCIVDEGAFFKDELLVKAITTSMSARLDPIKIYISTAGFDTTTWYYREWQYAEKVLKGEIKDPEYLPIIHAADPEDDPFSPETWARAMPAWDYFVNHDQIAKDFEKARHCPSDLEYYKALYLNLWSNPINSWIPVGLWDQCKAEYTEADLEGRECTAGLDLSINGDLTALVLLFRMDDGSYRSLFYNWIPSATVKQRSELENLPYQTWVKQGYCLTCQGETIKQADIRAKLNELKQRFRIKKLIIDRWNTGDMENQLIDDGFDIGPWNSVLSYYNLPAKTFEAMVKDRRIHQQGNPLVRTCLSNTAVYRNTDGMIKPVKPKDTKRIDPIVALLMALAPQIDQEATVTPRLILVDPAPKPALKAEAKPTVRLRLTVGQMVGTCWYDANTVLDVERTKAKGMAANGGAEEWDKDS